MSLSYSDLATGAVRSWVLLYTAGLAHEAREARRAEIDSDLWEHMSASHSDGDAAQTVREMLSRWLRGITADIFWRFSLKGEPRMVSRHFRPGGGRGAFGDCCLVDWLGCSQFRDRHRRIFPR